MFTASESRISSWSSFADIQPESESRTDAEDKSLGGSDSGGGGAAYLSEVRLPRSTYPDEALPTTQAQTLNAAVAAVNNHRLDSLGV
jgi:hypothetical protein